MTRQNSYVDRFKDYHSLTLRDVVRHVALSSLAALQKAGGRQAQSLRRNRVHHVYLHSVFRDEEDGFRALVQELTRTHVPISYSEAVERMRAGKIDQPYVTFSFDDGMKNNLTAARILDEFGVKACFFVCSDILGEQRFEKISDFCRNRLRSPPVEFLSWNDAEALLRSGHEIGCHSGSHAHLATLQPEELWSEIAESRAALERRLGTIRHFAWPYGRFFDVRPDIGELIAAAGYQSCASAERGCHVQTVGDSRTIMCLRRDHIVASWPLEHSLYFLAKSAARASDADNRWPAPTQVGK